MAASHDEKVFSQANQFDPQRGQAEDQISSFGGEISLASQFSNASFSSTLEVLCSLEKLSRAVGPTGRLKRIQRGAVVAYLNIEESLSVAYPGSMKVNWQA